jgi:hypothetical protein
MPPFSRSCLSLIAAALLLGCQPLNTVPAPLAPEEPTQQYELVLPGNLEVHNVEFSAALVSRGSVNDPSGGVEGRGFVKVYAVDRDSGDSVLLIYENVAERKEPVQVVRFRRSGSNDGS